jgi:hypothetical protein
MECGVQNAKEREFEEGGKELLHICACARVKIE